MNHQFKPGDLAMIVGALNAPSNIGKCVELIERLRPEAVSQWVNPIDGSHVRNRAGFPFWIVIGDDLTSRFPGPAGVVLVHERHLMPLRGDDKPAATMTTSIPQQAVTA